MYVSHSNNIWFIIVAISALCCCCHGANLRTTGLVVRGEEGIFNDVARNLQGEETQRRPGEPIDGALMTIDRWNNIKRLRSNANGNDVVEYYNDQYAPLGSEDRDLWILHEVGNNAWIIESAFNGRVLSARRGAGFSFDVYLRENDGDNRNDRWRFVRRNSGYRIILLGDLCGECEIDFSGGGGTSFRANPVIRNQCNQALNINLSETVTRRRGTTISGSTSAIAHVNTRGPTTWYRFVGTGDTYHFDLDCNSFWNSVIWVMGADSCSDLGENASYNGGGGVMDWSICHESAFVPNVETEPGRVYYIAVMGDTDQDDGNFELRIVKDYDAQKKLCVQSDIQEGDPCNSGDSPDQCRRYAGTCPAPSQFGTGLCDSFEGLYDYCRCSSATNTWICSNNGCPTYPGCV